MTTATQDGNFAAPLMFVKLDQEVHLSSDTSIEDVACFIPSDAVGQARTACWVNPDEPLPGILVRGPEPREGPGWQEALLWGAVRLEAALLCIKLQVSYTSGVFCAFVSSGPGFLNVHDYVPRERVGGRGLWMSTGRMGQYLGKFPEESWTALVEALRRQNRLGRALRRFGHAAHPNDPADECAMLMSSLEALLLPQRYEGELAYRLKLRAAWLTASSPEERNSVCDLVGKAYKIRSSQVHGLEEPTEVRQSGAWGVAGDAANLVGEALKRFLKMGLHRLNEADLDKALEHMCLGGGHCPT